MLKIHLLGQDMAQQVTMLDTKANGISIIPGTHTQTERKLTCAG